MCYKATSLCYESLITLQHKAQIPATVVATVRDKDLIPRSKAVLERKGYIYKSCQRIDELVAYFLPTTGGVYIADNESCK